MFLRLENLDVPPAAQVLVTRSPCYHPGDIRVLRPMLVSELIARAPSARRKLVEQQLAVLHDVVVFPTDGPRPHPDEMQGGDLDGDEFFVCWDPELLPRVQVDAASYAATKRGIFGGHGSDVDGSGGPFRLFQLCSHRACQ